MLPTARKCCGNQRAVANVSALGREHQSTGCRPELFNTLRIHGICLPSNTLRRAASLHEGEEASVQKKEQGIEGKEGSIILALANKRTPEGGPGASYDSFWVDLTRQVSKGLLAGCPQGWATPTSLFQMQGQPQGRETAWRADSVSRHLLAGARRKSCGT